MISLGAWFIVTFVVGVIVGWIMTYSAADDTYKSVDNDWYHNGKRIKDDVLNRTLDKLDKAITGGATIKVYQ